MWVEFLAFWVQFNHAAFFQCRHQLFQGQLHTCTQGDHIDWVILQGFFQTVLHRNHVFSEFLNWKFMRFSHIFRRTTTHIIHLSHSAQELVFETRIFCFQSAQLIFAHLIKIQRCICQIFYRKIHIFGDVLLHRFVCGLFGVYLLSHNLLNWVVQKMAERKRYFQQPPYP